MLENLQQDIRYGIRTLGKNPGFTVIAVLTLALGIGANTAIFSVVENLLLRALPYPQPERLVEIANTYLPQIPRAALSPGDYADWRRQNASFSEMGAYVSPRRFSSALVTIFAGLALLLAAIGIYGVMSYTVSQRTQEIELRMALGAQLASVQRMIVGQTLKLTLLGVGLGLAGAFVVARFLSSMLFGGGVYDPVTFVGVAALLIAVALMAAYVPARRACVWTPSWLCVTNERRILRSFGCFPRAT